MTKKKYALKYRECTNAELSQFLVSRRLSNSLSRRVYREGAIWHLESADREATFRFLDLPAEMRNLIYSEALTLRKEYDTDEDYYGKSCTSQLLATCKQVNQEAQDMLYDANEVTLTIDLVANISADLLESDLKVEVALNGHNVATLGDAPPKSMDWPSYLTRLRSVRLSLDMSRASTPNYVFDRRRRMEAVNQTLHDLQVFLTDSSKLHELHVEIYSDPRLPAYKTQNMFSPLCSLTARIPTTTFRFHNLSDSAATSIQLSHNLRKKLHGLEQKSILYLESTKDLRHWDILREALEYCDTCTTSIYSRGMFDIASDDRLVHAIYLFEAGLTEITSRGWQEIIGGATASHDE